MIKMMTKKDRAVSALLAAFPTPENFTAFSENDENAGALKTVLSYGKSEEIIASDKADDLKDFIRSHARSLKDCTPSEHIGFEKLLGEKDDLLKLNMSI